MTQPRFEHNCEVCRFLGQHTLDNTTYDLYYCPRDGLPDNLIARFGDEAAQFMCGIEDADLVPVLGEAKRRAIQQGIEIQYRPATNSTRV